MNLQLKNSLKTAQDTLEIMERCGEILRNCVFKILFSPFPGIIPFSCPSSDCDGLVDKSGPTLETPWTLACQAPLSMESSRQEYWSGLPFPSPGDLPNPGMKPRSLILQAHSLLSELSEKPPTLYLYNCCHILQRLV